MVRCSRPVMLLFVLAIGGTVMFWSLLLKHTAALTGRITGLATGAGGTAPSSTAAGTAVGGSNPWANSGTSTAASMALHALTYQLNTTMRELQSCRNERQLHGSRQRRPPQTDADTDADALAARAAAAAHSDAENKQLRAAAIANGAAAAEANAAARAAVAESAALETRFRAEIAAMQNDLALARQQTRAAEQTALAASKAAAAAASIARAIPSPLVGGSSAPVNGGAALPFVPTSATALTAASLPPFVPCSPLDPSCDGLWRRWLLDAPIERIENPPGCCRRWHVLDFFTVRYSAAAGNYTALLKLRKLDEMAADVIAYQFDRLLGFNKTIPIFLSAWSRTRVHDLFHDYVVNRRGGGPQHALYSSTFTQKLTTFEFQSTFYFEVFPIIHEKITQVDGSVCAKFPKEDRAPFVVWQCTDREPMNLSPPTTKSTTSIAERQLICLMHDVDVVNILVFDYLLNTVDRKGNCFALPDGNMIFLDNDSATFDPALQYPVGSGIAYPSLKRVRLRDVVDGYFRYAKLAADPIAFAAYNASKTEYYESVRAAEEAAEKAAAERKRADQLRAAERDKARKLKQKAANERLKQKMTDENKGVTEGLIRPTATHTPSAAGARLRAPQSKSRDEPPSSFDAAAASLSHPLSARRPHSPATEVVAGTEADAASSSTEGDIALAAQLADEEAQHTTSALARRGLAAHTTPASLSPPRGGRYDHRRTPHGDESIASHAGAGGRRLLQSNSDGGEAGDILLSIPPVAGITTTRLKGKTGAAKADDSDADADPEADADEPATDSESDKSATDADADGDADADADAPTASELEASRENRRRSFANLREKLADLTDKPRTRRQRTATASSSTPTPRGRYRDPISAPVSPVKPTTKPDTELPLRRRSAAASYPRKSPAADANDAGDGGGDSNRGDGAGGGHWARNKRQIMQRRRTEAAAANREAAAPGRGGGGGLLAKRAPAFELIENTATPIHCVFDRRTIDRLRTLHRSSLTAPVPSPPPSADPDAPPPRVRPAHDGVSRALRELLVADPTFMMIGTHSARSPAGAQPSSPPFVLGVDFQANGLRFIF